MQYVREARSKYSEALEKEKKEAAKSEKEKEETIQAAAKSLAPKLWESCILTPGPLKGSRASLGITLTPGPSSQSWN